jgi:hypothetical protein
MGLVLGYAAFADIQNPQSPALEASAGKGPIAPGEIE